MQKVSSEFSTSWWTDRVALYGSTTVSETYALAPRRASEGKRALTLGEGTTENVHIIRSGYSSRILEIKSVPIPAPVPPPSEWVIWKPLEGVTALGFPPNDIKDGVDQLRALPVS